MLPRTRLVLVFVAVLLLLAGFFTFNKRHEEEYSLDDSSEEQKLPEEIDALGSMKHQAFLSRKANAAFVVLAREVDLPGVMKSMQQMEDRFNHRYNYPWVFLNEKKFSDRFVNWTSAMTNAKTEYGVIPFDDWNQPPWINETQAALARVNMKTNDILYGSSISYRNMCRYQAGFFYRHPLLEKYRYYWRVEPGVKFYCDIDFDPFLYMQDNNKVYGFTVALHEYVETIPTLWASVKRFIKKYPEYIHPDNSMQFISNDNGRTYNLCHFWSNFEIADLDFWRSEAYEKFFTHLDRNGGFYYERWGDAPVHSIAVALLASREKVHYFSEIGYRHEPFEHCPTGEAYTRGKCWCSQDNTFDNMWYSCLQEFERVY